MPNATGRTLHIDRLTSAFAMGYRPEGMIADQIFPMVTVPKQHDVYPIFSRADMLRETDDLRAPSTEANRVQRTVSSATYHCKNYALMDSVPIEDKANMDAIYLQKLYNGRAAYVMNKLMLNWEIRVANMVTSTANVGSSAVTASSWSDATNSDPFVDVNVALDNIGDSTGVRPNRMVLGLTAWRYLRRSNAIINKTKAPGVAGGAMLPSVQQVADLFELDQILIGRAYKNSANQSQAESLSQIWHDNVLAYYAPSAPSIEVPSFGYSIRWQNGNLPNMQVERHAYDTRRKCEDVEVGYHQDEKITGSDYGFLITGVGSSQ